MLSGKKPISETIPEMIELWKCSRLEVAKGQGGNGDKQEVGVAIGRSTGRIPTVGEIFCFTSCLAVTFLFCKMGK